MSTSLSVPCMAALFSHQHFLLHAATVRAMLHVLHSNCPPCGLFLLHQLQCMSNLPCRVAEHVLQQLFPQQAPDMPAAVGPAAAAAAAGRRFKGLLKHSAPCPACSDLVGSEEFHMPLVECAAQLVAFIAGEVRAGNGVRGRLQAGTESTGSMRVALTTQGMSAVPRLWKAFPCCLEGSSRR